MDACCAVPANGCHRDPPYCHDRASSSDWLFGLWPGPPQRFETTGTITNYQYVTAVGWPSWGRDDLSINTLTSGAPGGVGGACFQGRAYRGADSEICGGNTDWGATDVEVWYPRSK